LEGTSFLSIFYPQFFTKTLRLVRRSKRSAKTSEHPHFSVEPKEHILLHKLHAPELSRDRIMNQKKSHPRLKTRLISVPDSCRVMGFKVHNSVRSGINTVMKLIVLACLIALPVAAQFSVEEQMRFCAYTNDTGEVFNYRMAAPRFPAEGKNFPMIIFLHGSGECGTDNKRHIKMGLPSLMRSLLMQNQQAVVLAYQCQRGNWWVGKLAMQPDYRMSKNPTASMEVLMEIVGHIREIQPVDPERIYITGLSLGGFGTWDAIQRWPDLFAAAVPICGGGDISQAKRLKQIPLWAFHGDKDKNVNVECTRRMIEAMRRSGSRRYRYTEYPGVAHNSWDKAYHDQEMITWLFKQRKIEKKPFWKFW